MKRKTSLTPLLALASAATLLASGGVRADGADPAAESVAFTRADQDQIHWAFKPLTRPAASSPSDPASISFQAASLDAFVRAPLKARGFTPNPPAAPRDLIRRLHFDLIGLPPTPEEVESFETDPSEEQYRRRVDELLARPQYGERWARHWLDLARYTESSGFEYDRLRDNAWHYRDYVIRSFNEDKPYDRFIREQIAGDVLEPVTRDGILATSLLVCGAYDQAGNSQANATQRAITREEELEDLLSVVGQTFLGLTLNCARCHDHKFDPISLTEYYRIKSVFDGIQHGERPIESTGSGPDAVAYAGKRTQPAPTQRLKRGDVTSPDGIVTPGALSVLGQIPHDFGLPADAPEAQRRIRFAEWLSDPRNPLPARVMANRVWQHHFGQGLVATPSDFGTSGAKPTHPELLDWLAVHLIDSGWSLKSLHRLIVNSAAYRQSSEFNAEAAAMDADNQLLWRYPPRRLEAETLRDAMLAVSGRLNPQVGGPSFRPFTTTDFNATFYHPFDKDEPEYNRRTVYRMNVNSGKEPLLDAFDCPDPSVKTPRRATTTTPLQALGLMNGTFTQRQARLLAERAQSAARDDLPAAIQRAYRIALARPPSAAESQRALNAARERGLASVCWVLLNSTEFLYVR